MKDIFTDKMNQEFYDEQLMQSAAKIIDVGLLEEAASAQAEEIDELWLQGLKKQAIKAIEKKKWTARAASIVKRIGRSAAIFLLTACVLLGGIYVSVDAAREKINNFLLGNRNSRNAVVLPVYWDAADYTLIPIKWTCSVYPTWIPEGYKLAGSGTQLDQYWWLIYYPKETPNQSICIYIWDNTYKPNIDVESYEVVSEKLIQGVSSTIYYDTKHALHSLIMVKNDLTIQIIGTISSIDILDIAENLVF